MQPRYHLISQLERVVDPVAEATLSKTVFEDDQAKVVLFAMAAGQELSRHTASRPAMLQFLSGEADLGLDDDLVPATAGTWVHMPAGLPHSIRAKTTLQMLLVLFKSPVPD